jgi:hypothetical protein
VAAGPREPEQQAREPQPRPYAGPEAAVARAGLEARQRALVAALVAGAQTPAGLDGARVRVQAAALLRKRGRGVAHAAPDLAVALGPAFRDAFESYARGRPGPPPDCAADDAAEFARYLRGAGAGGRPHPDAEVRRAARRVTRPRLLSPRLRSRHG